MNAQQFWSRVKIGAPDECWEWQGYRKETGYGRISNSKYNQGEGPRSWRAHRLAYQFHHGVEPGDLHVLHSCDNPPCCNPAHLRLGTPADNGRDKVERGRSHNVPKGAAHKLAKLTDDKVREIKRRFVRGRRGDGPRAAREFGVSPTIIHQILRGEIWKHVA